MSGARIDTAILMAYVDGEVDIETARDIERSLANDAEARARVAQLRHSAQLARAAFADALYEPVPEAMKAAILNAPDKVVAFSPRAGGAATGRYGVLRRWALPMAATLAGIVIGLGFGHLDDVFEVPPLTAAGMSPQRAAWLDQVVNFHKVYTGIYEGQERALVDISGEEPPKLESWFGERLKRDLKVPDLTALDHALQGGRLLVVGGRPAAQIVYVSHEGKPLALSILPQPGRDRQPTFERRNGTNVLHWRTADYSYALIGTAERELMFRIADQVAPTLSGT
jgi:anti-sigma factor RsiW